MTAERYLLKQMAKTKRIAQTPEFEQLRSSTSVSLAGPQNPAEANVIARLFKSNPVKKELPPIISSLRATFGLDDETQPTPKQNNRESKTKGKSTSSAGDISENESDASESDTSRSAGHQLPDGDISMDDASVVSAEYSQFNDRLASSEEDSASDVSHEQVPTHKHYDAAEAMSLSSESPSRSSSEPSKIKGRRKTKPTKDTTFLPSLMAGYWSGSESAEDVDVAPKKRKNRMGQKARRALWEKKYGQNAKHIRKKKEKNKSNRDQGWDLRRGATDETGDSGRKAKGRKLDSKSKPQGSGDASKPTKAPASEDKPLHPSWEAARKAKEKSTQATFQGKKITFD